MLKRIQSLVLLALVVSTSCPTATSTGAVVSSPTEPHAQVESSFSSSPSSSASNDLAVAPRIVFGALVKTVDTVESSTRNWVGPTIGAPDRGDNACYRKAHIMKTCPIGFDYKWKTCWTQCPLTHPVKCGLECIQQNDDCGLEYYAKTSNVVQAAISLATMGMFGQLTAAAKKVVAGAKCIRAMIGNIKMLINYIRTIKVYDPQIPFDRIMNVLYSTSYVTIDFPVIIAMCFGLPYPAVMDPASWILDSIQLQLGEILSHGDDIIRGWDRFTAFLKHTNFTQPLAELNETEISSLKTGLASNSTCGYELKRLTDHTWITVAQMKKEKAGITQDELRVAMYQSDLFIRAIPTVTNNCMDQFIAESSEATAYETRDTLRKTLGVIVDDLIDTGSSDNGTSLTAKEYVRVVTDKVAMTAFVLGVDSTGILGVITEYVQPICGPTQFIGEIDDGTEPNTLGLNIVGKAFVDSSLVWKKAGNGVVNVTFEGTDTKNVTVNIFSGGDKVDEKDVLAGGTATWTSNVTALGGKTLYLDRWRPGFLGLPGTGGGSLKLWVPRANEGGHLDLSVKLNTS